MRLDFAELNITFGINTREYFADELTQLEEFYEDKLLSQNEDGLIITPRGRHFTRNIGMVFDAYLSGLTAKATVKKPIFSRTI